MAPPVRYSLGDVVRMKKQHPCGSFEWEILRVGMDFRIRCLKCGRMVMLPRPKFEKSVKALVKSALPDENHRLFVETEKRMANATTEDFIRDEKAMQELGVSETDLDGTDVES